MKKVKLTGNDIDITFQEFLKQYSCLNNDFIDDFFENFNKIDIEYYEDCVIDLDKLVRWLKISENGKNKIILRINKTYEKEVDYIIKKVPIPNSKTKQKRVIYYLTIQVAKKIMQRTKSPVGDEIRNYFIEVEYLLRKYYMHIIYSLKNKTNEILQNKKPSVNPKAGLIYIVEVPTIEESEEKDKKYKVGKTVNIKKRLASHNCANSTDLVIKFKYETEELSRVESCIKNILKPTRVRNDREIYKLNLTFIKKIVRRCSKFINDPKNSVLKGKLSRTSTSNIDKVIEDMDDNKDYYLVIDYCSKCPLSCSNDVKEHIYNMICTQNGGFSTKDISTKDIGTKDIGTKDISTKDIGTKDISTKFQYYLSKYTELKNKF